MREQHELELGDERVQWLRDRRVDLYIRITTLFNEAQRIFDSLNSTNVKNASITEKINAASARMEALNAEAAAATAKIETQQQPGVSSAMMAERDDIMASTTTASCDVSLA